MSLNKTYHNLLQTILEEGYEKEDRTGTGTISSFGHLFEHDMRTGFPLINTKFTWFHGIKHELLWFLQGDSNIKYLVDNNVHIWNDWPYKRYAEFAKNLEEPDYDYLVDDPNQNKTRIFTQGEFIQMLKLHEPDSNFVLRFGELGPVYGTQWINWEGWQEGWISAKAVEFDDEITTDGINQIQNVINQLKTNPDSRRILVNAYNISEIENMVLPPCHYAFQFWTRELTYSERFEIIEKRHIKKVGHNLGLNHDHIDQQIEKETPSRGISLMFHMRSVDTFLGLPFNIASYALLLEMIAQQVDMVPLDLKATFGDTHIYKNHVEQVNQQLANDTEKYPLPTIKLNKKDSMFDYEASDIELINYKSFGKIKAPISV